MHELNSFKIFV